MAELNSHSFKQVYDWLGVSVGKLGCVMLDLIPMDNMHSIAVEGAEVALYYSEHPDRFWINGWIADQVPHITLLYGLMQPATQYEMHIKEVLKGWHIGHVEIEGIDFFNSPYDDEPYYCIIAKIKKDEKVMEGNNRLKFLPHINTFMDYTPHMTICYIKKSQGEEYRDNMIEHFKKLWVGKKLEVKPGLNLGHSKPKRKKE